MRRIYKMRQLKIIKQVTNRNSVSLDKYLHEISKEDLITAQEEVVLAIKIKEGDEKALNKLTRANLRFVVSVAKQYQNQGLTLSDLINEGNLGLIKAAKKFDETRGFKFISYAVWWIRQTILQSIAEHARIVRLPLNKLGIISKINKAYSELEQTFERAPSIEEIAEIIDVSAKEIAESLKNRNKSISMDAPLTANDDSGTMHDTMESSRDSRPDSGLMNESLKKEIKRALSILSERESDVLKLYYGINNKVNTNLTLEEIGTRFGLTRERVRQIKEKAISRLRSYSMKNNLVSYLG
ncbi:MAG: RNA polymerase primary sigma factor [Saprospiraceae bacterium]